MEKKRRSIFQWKRSVHRSKEVPATFGSETLKEVPVSEALRACTSFNYFICFPFQWKRSVHRLKKVPATFGSETLKEVPVSEALRACTSFNYFICNIPFVICKLELVFCFSQIISRQLKKQSEMFPFTKT